MGEMHLPMLTLEQCVLGCMISTSQNFVDGCATLTAEHFSSAKERMLFNILLAAYKDKPEFVDAVVIMNYSKLLKLDHPDIDIEYITYLVDCSNIFKYEEYKRQLSNNLTTKRFLTLLKQYPLNVNTVNIEESIGNFIKIASDICQKACGSSLVSIEHVLDGREGKSNIKGSLLEQIQQKRNDKSLLYKDIYKTGFLELDKIILGVKKTNVIIVGARASMGKTSLAINIMLNLCKNNPQCIVGIISLEMSCEQLTYRMLSCIAGVNSTDIETGNISEDEYNKVQHAFTKLKNLKIILEDSFSVNLSGLRTTITSMKYKDNVDIVIIDYIQLINADGRRVSEGNRNLELSEISRSLKMLATELNIAILCLSQLSRKVEDRPDRRPRMSDIRDSGSIEQDADQILLMYRPSYYELDSDKELLESIDQVFINVVKNRCGKTGTFVLAFDKDKQQFRNI